MAIPYVLDATVVQQETEAAAEIVFLPREALHFLWRTPGVDPVEQLGLVRGVQIPSPEAMEDVFFASMSGRAVPFDEGSFDRWRPQREARAGSPQAVFAHQLVTGEFVPVASSPVRGTSLASLLVEGTGWTVGVAEAVTTNPLRGLAVLVLTELGLTVAQLAGAARSTAVIWVKWRLRQRLGIPPDWLPPEDRLH